MSASVCAPMCLQNTEKSKECIRPNLPASWCALNLIPAKVQGWVHPIQNLASANVIRASAPMEREQTGLIQKRKVPGATVFAKIQKHVPRNYSLLHYGMNNCANANALRTGAAGQQQQCFDKNVTRLTCSSVMPLLQPHSLMVSASVHAISSYVPIKRWAPG